MSEDFVKHGAQHPLPACQTGELAHSVILAAGFRGVQVAAVALVVAGAVLLARRS